MTGTQEALATLNAPGKKARVHNAQMVTKLPQAVKDLINHHAEANDVSEATIVRWALADYFEKRGDAAEDYDKATEYK